MIRIGINVPNFGPETDPASLLGWAQYADRNGFATLLVSDHVAPAREITDTYPAPFYDPFVLLGWLADRRGRSAWEYPWSSWPTVTRCSRRG